jgi:hypothetical protein
MFTKIFYGATGHTSIGEGKQESGISQTKSGLEFFTGRSNVNLMM